MLVFGDPFDDLFMGQCLMIAIFSRMVSLYWVKVRILFSNLGMSSHRLSRIAFV